jgi:hypothetical protein
MHKLNSKASYLKQSKNSQNYHTLTSDKTEIIYNRKFQKIVQNYYSIIYLVQTF